MAQYRQIINIQLSRLQEENNQLKQENDKLKQTLEINDNDPISFRI